MLLLKLQLFTFLTLIWAPPCRTTTHGERMQERPHLSVLAVIQDRQFAVVVSTCILEPGTNPVCLFVGKNAVHDSDCTFSLEASDLFLHAFLY